MQAPSRPFSFVFTIISNFSFTAVSQNKSEVGSSPNTTYDERKVKEKIRQGPYSYVGRKLDLKHSAKI